MSPPDGALRDAAVVTTVMAGSRMTAGATPIDRATRLEPIEVVAMEFGRFPEITRLNPRFVADAERLKLTLDVSLASRAFDRAPASFIEPLKGMLPTLARHRCCGDNRIHETFFAHERRRACTLREADATVDVAHLLEHLVIDFQHYIAGMKSCSGVTCGYESPRYRYDVFVESPGRSVTSLCIELAMDLMNSLLRGEAPDPLYASVVKLARGFHQSPGKPISATAAEGLLVGDHRAREALRLLRETGFIREIETSINFSRVALFELDAKSSSGANG